MTSSPEFAGFISGLPLWLQIVVSLGFGIGTAIGARLIYRTTKNEPPPAKPSDLVVTSASLTDMTPIRDLSRNMGDLITETRGVRHACDAILAHLLEIERERDEDRRVERRVKEELIRRAKVLAPDLDDSR